jgi:uncharacterized integral membrane protein (TIGR00698 family)
LLLGMVMNSVAGNPASEPGIQFAASTVLKAGVALLGLRITAGQIAGLGWATALIVVLGVLGTIALGIGMARALKLSPTFGVIAGGATAICGASAALAISSVMPKSESKQAETVLVVALVTTLSTLAMIFYPGLSVLLGFDDHQAGVLFGASIHDVAQVVGAGYAVSDEAGDTATIVKLFRVTLLLPVVLLIGIVVGRGGNGEGGFPLPPFAIAFAALVLFNSVVALPAPLLAGAESLSRWCLVAAVAALGMRTSLADLGRSGPRPLVAVFAATLGLLVFITAALHYQLL